MDLLVRGVFEPTWIGPKSEIRNPKAERGPRAEIRISLAVRAVRISDFDFDIDTSPNLHPRVISAPGRKYRDVMRAGKSIEEGN